MTQMVSTFFNSLLFCWCSPTPQKFRENQTIDENWCRISVQKRDQNGNFKPDTYLYTLDQSSGDLYGLQNYREERVSVALKCVQVFLIAPIYGLAMTICALSRMIFQGNFFLELKRILWAPFYTAAIMIGALWGVFQPYEGRKKVAEIEYQWHEKTPYTMDIRYDGPHDGFFRVISWLVKNALSEIKKGKVFFLTYCFQKRGNLNEEISPNMRKYKIVN